MSGNQVSGILYDPTSARKQDINGMTSLAMAEMSFAMAVLFRPGGPDISLYETDESDIAQAVDFLMPLPKLDSRGTRIMVN